MKQIAEITKVKTIKFLIDTFWFEDFNKHYQIFKFIQDNFCGESNKRFNTTNEIYILGAYNSHHNLYNALCLNDIRLSEDDEILFNITATCWNENGTFEDKKSTLSYIEFSHLAFEYIYDYNNDVKIG